MKKQRYDLNDLGSNVKMMRKARKISQVKLSEALQMSQPHLSNLECGRTLISLEILVKLADVFDCSVEDIYSAKSCLRICEI